MARWKLTEPHYLNVPGTRWEQILTDRGTGKPVRKVYEVPLFLHPEDPADWTVKDARTGDGDIFVCYEGKGQPTDIVFVGNPTPGMLPVDEEAQQISAGFSKLWKPTTGTDEQAQMESFQQKLLNGMFDQMSILQTSTAAPAAPGMEKFMELMMAMMQQQTQILAAIAGKGQPAPAVTQEQEIEFARIGEALGEKSPPPEDERLEDAEPTEAELAEAAAAAADKEAASTARATAHLASRRI